jgi:hypothetical protein
MNIVKELLISPDELDKSRGVSAASGLDFKERN